ncbi:hypothetical protein NW767_008795 [Fusarium falciforme]|nr:hypothetical protein NW767_008795 [Fusarium falciforme]KAJ4248546.1 hypothetical protein NW757_008194 [Fusarium falciforme]
MIGLGEWLAISSLVMQVVAAVHAVIQIFEKAQNVPKELEDLRCSLLRLSDNFEQVRAQAEATGSGYLRRYDFDEIRNTLRDSKKFLDDYRSAQSKSDVLRAVWGTQNHDAVVRYQTLIDRHLWQILIPFWLKSLNGTARGSNDRDHAKGGSVGGFVVVRRNSCVPQQQLDNLTQGFE